MNKQKAIKLFETRLNRKFENKTRLPLEDFWKSFCWKNKQYQEEMYKQRCEEWELYNTPDTFIDRVLNYFKI